MARCRRRFRCPPLLFTQDHVDELSRRCGHYAYIFEASGNQPKKIVNLMVSFSIVGGREIEILPKV